VDEPRTPTERFEADLRRTVDRLRTLGLDRLTASFEPEPTRADAATAAAQRLADAAADLEGAPRRTVPRLADPAVGDQLAVCGHDLLAVAAVSTDRACADEALTRAADDLLGLRRRI